MSETINADNGQHAELHEDTIRVWGGLPADEIVLDEAHLDMLIEMARNLENCTVTFVDADGDEKEIRFYEYSAWASFGEGGDEKFGNLSVEFLEEVRSEFVGTDFTDYLHDEIGYVIRPHDGEEADAEINFADGKTLTVPFRRVRECDGARISGVLHEEDRLAVLVVDVR